MKLKIPKEKAIDILKRRQSEIYSVDFEPTVWKAAAENDCREIFDGLDFKWLNISQINFTTPFSDQKYAVLEKGKEQANKYIDSFIQQINEYAEIEEMKAVEREKYYEQEYKQLEQQTTQIIAQTNELIKDQNKYLDELKEQDAEIDKLKRETVQLSEITLVKLFKLISNLPIAQTIGLITTIIGIIGFSIYCGTLIEKHTTKNSQFEDQIKIQRLRENERKLLDTVDVLNKKIKTKNKTISELNNELSLKTQSDNINKKTK